MMKNINYILLLSFTLLASCGCDFEGSHDLGHNFTLLEGDRLEDRVIVSCPDYDDRCCMGGLNIIPGYERHMENGKYSEYVLEAKSDKKWIIAKTFKVNNKEILYWILYKDFEVPEEYKNSPLPEKEGKEFELLIQSHITGPMDKETFIEKTKELNINLNFD